MRLTGWGVSLAAVVLSSGCAAGTQSGESGGSRNILTREQLMATQEGDLFSAVQQLRPQWLRARGAARISGFVEVIVYVDDIRRGGVGNLRSIRLEGVERVQFLSATEATTRWGTDVSGGVISVTRMR